LNTMRLYHGSKSGLLGAIAPTSRDVCDFENQRKLAVRMVDRIRLLHRRDGMSFQEIIERDTGRKWDEP